MRLRAAFLRAAALTIAVTVVGGCLLIAGTQGLTGGTPSDDAAADAPVAEAAPSEASAESGGSGDARSDAPPSDGGVDVVAVADATPDATPDATSDADAAPDSPALPTLVQQVSGSEADASAVTLTLAAPPAAGDMLVLATSNGDMAPTSVLGPGATWTERAESGDHVVTSMWTASRVTSAAQSVTIAWTPPTSAFSGSLSEWTGISSYVASQTNYATGPVTTATIGASPGQLVYACAAMHGPDDNDMVTGLSGGFTALQYAGLAHEMVLAAYLAPSSPGTYLAQWTQTVSADGWDAIIVTLGP